MHICNGWVFCTCTDALERVGGGLGGGGEISTLCLLCVDFQTQVGEGGLHLDQSVACPGVGNSEKDVHEQ